MRSKEATWFEAKVCYEKICEDGANRKVHEAYVVDALSYTEAEKRITEEVAPMTCGEFEVENLKKAQYREVFFADAGDADDIFFKAKVDFITLDEKTEKEKRSKTVYLIQAGSLHEAVKKLGDVMDGTMADYEACALDKTNIVDVFEYESVGKEEQ